MPTINIEGGGSFACRSGCILLDALLSGNAFSESPCGGRGLCGKCRVTVLSGAVSEITPDELRLLDKEEIKQGVRLSCMTKVLGDCSIRLPKKESGHRILTGGLLPEFDRDPLKGFGIAADIGTTTIALSLMDLESGNELFSASDINPSENIRAGRFDPYKLRNGAWRKSCGRSSVSRNRLHEPPDLPAL